MTSRLSAHALVAEGAPHDNDGNRLRAACRWWATTGDGRAKCTCGEMSEVLETTAARKQWHRDHKNQIKADRVLEEIKQAGGFSEWLEQQR